MNNEYWQAHKDKRMKELMYRTIHQHAICKASIKEFESQRMARRPSLIKDVVIPDNKKEVGESPKQPETILSQHIFSTRPFSYYGKEVEK